MLNINRDLNNDVTLNRLWCFKAALTRILERLFRNAATENIAQKFNDAWRWQSLIVAQLYHHPLEGTAILQIKSVLVNHE
jgi:hypothetical protein